MVGICNKLPEEVPKAVSITFKRDLDRYMAGVFADIFHLFLLWSDIPRVLKSVIPVQEKDDVKDGCFMPLFSNLNTRRRRKLQTVVDIVCSTMGIDLSTIEGIFRMHCLKADNIIRDPR